VEIAMADPTELVRRQVTIVNALGLHIRPATKFVKLASRDGYWCQGTDIGVRAFFPGRILVSELFSREKSSDTNIRPL
jgi:hypothetical protein